MGAIKGSNDITQAVCELDATNAKNSFLQSLIDMHALEYEKQIYGEYTNISVALAEANLGEIWMWLGESLLVDECLLVLLPPETPEERVRHSRSFSVVVQDDRNRNRPVGREEPDGWAFLRGWLKNEPTEGIPNLLTKHRVCSGYFLYQSFDEEGNRRSADGLKKLSDLLDVHVDRYDSEVLVDQFERPKAPEAGCTEYYQRVILVFGCADLDAATRVKSLAEPLVKQFLTKWGLHVKEQHAVDRNLYTQERELAHEVGQVAEFLGEPWVLPLEECNQILARAEEKRGLRFRNERERDARGIVAHEAFNAASYYIRLWAETTEHKFWNDLLAKTQSADDLLIEANAIAQKAGFAYRAKALDDRNLWEHSDEFEAYCRFYENVVICPKPLNIAKSIGKKEKQLLVKAVSAACLNAVKHTLELNHLFVGGTCPIVLYADSSEIMIANPMQSPEFGDSDGDGSVRTIQGMCDRLTTYKIQFGLKRLAIDEMPIICRSDSRIASHAFWCCARFTFSVGTILQSSGD